MLKFLTLLNLPGILLFELFFGGNISITHDMPTTMAPGSEVKVTVRVDKQQLSGFAKLQIDLPQGFNASAIETKGASFTFADGKAKFIWMALPAQPSFTVSYTLSATASASGSQPVMGRFSYIEENERKTAEMPTSTITISGTAGTIVDLATPPAVESATMNDVVSASGAAPMVSPVVTEAPASTSNITMIPAQQGAGSVGGKRTVTSINATEVLVEVTVDKGNIRGFGKLQETIPAGFTAISQINDEAIFTTQDRIVKFVWLNLPSKSTMSVSYKLRSNGQPEGEYAVNGDFGYLLNDETQKAVIGTTKFNLGLPTPESAPVAVTTTQPERTLQTATPVKTTPEPVQQPVAVVTPPTTRPTPTPVVSEPAPVTAQASKPRSASRIPSPETGITYKVQITAAHREVGSPYFQKRHRYSGDFTIEHHQGWIKYVTGRYDAYAQARGQRDKYVADGHNFPGPFVTAYNNGERITVQEALMLSNQRSAQ